MRIAFFGYDFHHACLCRIIEEHQIVALFTVRTDNIFNFNIKVLQEAERLNVPAYLGPVTDDQIGRLVQDGCELLVSAGYPYKIPVRAEHDEPQKARIRGINVHPTLLPIGRGRSPLPWIILREPRAAGITIHKLTSKWDAGDILLQEPIRLVDLDDHETLSIKIQMRSVALMADLLRDFDALWSAACPQGAGGSCWPPPTLEDRLLDWSKPVSEIMRTARAFSKHQTMARLGNLELAVTRVNGWTEAHNHPLGQIVHAASRELLVAALDGYICLQEFGSASDQQSALESN
jgi:methionyl-tRNA formyltransferase